MNPKLSILKVGPNKNTLPILITYHKYHMQTAVKKWDNRKRWTWQLDKEKQHNKEDQIQCRIKH